LFFGQIRSLWFVNDESTHSNKLHDLQLYRTNRRALKNINDDDQVEAIDGYSCKDSEGKQTTNR
jgi:hypothetical protein